LKTILVPFGTRPEIVKLAPIVETLSESGFQLRTLATGQHDDPALSDAFFEDLGLEPDVRWLLEGDTADRLATMVVKAERELAARAPDLVLLLGDTNTIPVFCLAARRHGVPVAHLEAGLRSWNERSMEEVNRKVAAACASLHFAPTNFAARCLLTEGIASERVQVVGNPVIDVLRRREIRPVRVSERSSIIFTAHRATNVDDPDRLGRLVELVHRLSRQVAPVNFPVHPRTQMRLAQYGLQNALEEDGIHILPPLPYDEMLAAVARSKLVVTDSGGLQEEAAYLGVPVIVLRRSTPRWEGVAAGTSVLVGLDLDVAIEAARHYLEPEVAARIAATPCPYGDGHTSERVAETLSTEETWKLLLLKEPDLTGHFPESALPPVP
jgi:UDP-N-acetylglucosamine 2-epimerase (non-hydrolysing)